MYDNQGQGGYKGGNDKKQFGGPKQMFSAICADCRKPCQVPFRPSGDKPIYCKDCFIKRKEPQQSSGGVQLIDLKRQMDLMSEKLDVLLQKLEGAGSKAKKSTVKKTPAKKVKKAGKK